MATLVKVIYSQSLLQRIFPVQDLIPVSSTAGGFSTTDPLGISITVVLLSTFLQPTLPPCLLPCHPLQSGSLVLQGLALAAASPGSGGQTPPWCSNFFTFLPASVNGVLSRSWIHCQLESQCPDSLPRRALGLFLLCWSYHSEPWASS